MVGISVSHEVFETVCRLLDPGDVQALFRLDVVDVVPQAGEHEQRPVSPPDFGGGQLVEALP
jgi:hypothetical protein